MRYSYKIVR